MEKTNWSIGIDPGLTETGMVLCVEKDGTFELVEWASYSCPPGDPDLTRAMSMAECVVDRMLGWIGQYEINALDVAIEMPVYKHNAASYTKQIRLVEEIQSGLYHLIASVLDSVYCTEVNPMTSKALLTNNGRAGKAEMVETFERLTNHAWPKGTRGPTKEAIADAFAHCQACWWPGMQKTTGVNRMNLTALTAADVIARGEYCGEHC